MTLLLGPPGAGKTTLLLALAGKLDKDLKVCSYNLSNIISCSCLILRPLRNWRCWCYKVSGRISYCGHELSEFIPERTCAYIGQHDLHQGEMTVRETLDFSGRCLGVGTRHELLMDLSRLERAAGIKPDPELDAFMKATAVSGQSGSFAKNSSGPIRIWIVLRC